MNFLRKFHIFIFSAASMLAASSARSEVAFMYHFAGGFQLANQTNLAALHEVLTAPATAGMESIALARFSKLLAESLPGSNSASSNALLEPLLRDLAGAESMGSIGVTKSHGPNFILVLQLGTDRAQAWQDDLAKFFGHAGESFSVQGFNGARWASNGSNALWIMPAQDWLLAGCGDEFSAQQAEYLTQIKTKGRPAPPLQNQFLEADLSSVHLGGWFRWLKPAGIKISAAANDLGEVQINAHVAEAEAIDWKSTPWQIPKSLLRNLTISFSAGQDVAAFLNIDPAYAHFPGNPLTNQFCAWALDQLPMLNYMAWPEPEASNVLQNLSAEAPATLNPFLKQFNGMEMVWQSAPANQLVCQNVSFFAPTLQAVQNGEGSFLFMSTFPLVQSQPGPDTVAGPLQGRSDLVYHHWEATAKRLREWQVLSKMIANRAPKSDKESLGKAAAEAAWLGTLARLPGDTTTEITHVSPTELMIARNSPVGFTAMELVLLADWICEANNGAILPPPPHGRKPPIPPPPHR